jgi:arylsulfatase A-like enzyme
LLAVWLGAAAGFLLVGCSPQGSFDNVVLVTIDTLRADHLGCYGYPRPTSPFIDSLAVRGVRFENAVSASSHTAPSHASIFTSHYPARHGVFRNGLKLEAQAPTLASVLQQNFIETAAVTSVKFLKGISRGFETVRLPQKRGGYRSGDQTVDDAVDWFKSRPENRRFALWVHLYDVHDSKRSAVHKQALREHLAVIRSDASDRGEALAEYLGENQGIAEEVLERDLDQINRYDAQIRLVDTELARLFDEISNQTRGQSNLWVITADHGEGLGSHSYLEHGRYLYDEQIRIPLIFFGGSKFESGLVVPTLVRSVDLFPTIVDLMGLDAGASDLEWEGRTLRGLLEGVAERTDSRIAFAQRRPVDERRLRLGWADESVMMARIADSKYIRHTASEDEFYDLGSDPLETKNLAGQGSDSERRLARWLARKYSAMSSQPLQGAGGGVEVDVEFIEELQALGYLD